MELTQLEFFLMVVDQGSFSKAAVRVFRQVPYLTNLEPAEQYMKVRLTRLKAK